MGEHNGFPVVRACSAAVLALAAAAALSSCSSPGVAPGAAPAPSTSVAVIDPSIPSATPTETEAPAPSTSPTPVEKVTATPAPADARTAVTPFITSALWDATAQRLDVSAIVPGVVEGDGTCTVTASAGDAVRTASAKSVAASSYTGCEQVSFAGLAAGAWQVRVRYASDHAVGASASRTVTAG